MGDLEQNLAWAVQNGEIEDVKNILAENKESKLVMAPYQGRLPLHRAADYGQKEVMAYLIDNGANVNMPDKHGITPLLAAIFEGHTSCVELLLSKGADKDGKAPDGSSYIDSAESDAIKALLK